MKKQLSIPTRFLLLISAVLLICVLFIPLWRIELNAPQYPEGLMLLIHPNAIKGNVDIINGLNHYIGMKTLHTEDFPEFKVLPYIIAFFSLFALVVALVNRSRWLYALFFAFLAFGIIAMVDFWKWEYDYGHNLNPNAAIVVPGMAYQPPLVGFKQLLNFGAYSIPDKGGWLFIGVGVMLLVCVVIEWYRNKKSSKNVRLTNALLLLSLPILLYSCEVKPEAIKVGTDACAFCKMTISDVRFGAELVTAKGKIYKFDDIHCLLSFRKEGTIERTAVRDIYLVDFCEPHSLVNANQSFVLQSSTLRGPMNGEYISFASKDSMEKAKAIFEGNAKPGSEVIK